MRPLPSRPSLQADAHPPAPLRRRIDRADVFCRVVDNYGDAGVCWRLARRLARDHGLHVRLFIDRQATLDAFVACDADDARLRASGRIACLTWDEAIAGPVAPAPLVIETFGSDVPAAYAEAMAACAVPPLWVNLEYLSAEDWVEGCHGLPSPHPVLPLTRLFWFPGFTARTGGLLREPGLLARLQALAPVHAPMAAGAPLITTLFCYDHALVEALLHAWAEGPWPVHCRLFAGPSQTRALAWACRQLPGANPLAQPVRVGALTLEPLPWMGQAALDAVLAGAHFNVVRGEDTFVRAQWAGQPFLWDIYPQQDDAHLVKMAAFLRLYRAQQPAGGAALGALWQAFVRRDAQTLREAWPPVLEQLLVLAAHARHWRDQLAEQPDVVDALLDRLNLQGPGIAPE